jgi:hypothetical protein
MIRVFVLSVIFMLLPFAGVGNAADTVPTDIQQPGTQPQEISTLETPDKCDNCHGGYNSTVEPAHNWRGSMMAQAGRDPIFWATLAIAEQDFDGAGDLCIRCHSTAGWLAGRSTPTDGSGLGQSDGDGVECEFCHKLTNPDDSEHLGTQLPPFLANDLSDPGSDPDNVIGYFGSGMASLWPENSKLGPYADTAARHQFMQSQFHRDVDFCGTCHDVSNPAVGNLAPNNGTQSTADPVVANWTLGGPVDGKAAFNNLPYIYGIVERTFSEYKSGLLSQTPVSAYLTLPADLQAGAIKAGYESALVAGRGGDYEDGSTRYFSCQTCHMRPVNGPGCNKKGAPVRKDLPLHDMTGGNYWMPDAITYLDAQGKLRLGGGMTGKQIAAINDGKTRAMKQLNEALSLEVIGNTLRVINLTGHKLISGYPEGRRMWLNIVWYDADMNVLREDGKYGTLTVNIDGSPTDVDTILDLHDPNTKIFEAHYGMTQDWARGLLALHPADLALSYDRVTGEPDFTLGDLAGNLGVPADPSVHHETFHFVLNNTVVKDNRIPPYGMRYEEARIRNALPVPDTQYGGGPVYNYWDEVTLNPPAGALYATISMLYQPTSWEYIQFLYLANNGPDPAQGGNAFLGMEGEYMLEAWLNNGMAHPYIMATASWGTPPEPSTVGVIVDSLTTWSVSKKGQIVAMTDTFNVRNTVGIVAHVVDEDHLSPISGAQVFLEIRNQSVDLEISLQGFSDNDGNALMKWKTGRRQATGTYTADVVDIIISGYEFNAGVGQTSAIFTLQ